MSSALTAQPALRARRPRRARHLREQGPKRCQSGHGAGQWPWAQSSLHLRGPASAASARLQLPRAINLSAGAGPRLYIRLSQIVQLVGPTFRDLTSVQQMLQHLEAQLSTFNISYSPVQYLSPKTLQKRSKLLEIAQISMIFLKISPKMLNFCSSSLVFCSK